jgi:hypothetical protein
MKFYKRISRFQFRRWFPKGSREERKLFWGASLKEGDIIGACTGFNVRIDKITPCRSGANTWFAKSSRNKEGWFINNFYITDTQGVYHLTDSCCYPKETVDEIKKGWMEYCAESPSAAESKIGKALLAGEDICDQDGLILDHLR